MSCTSRHKSQCGNPQVIEAACERMKDRAKFLGQVNRYGKQGAGVSFRNWHCDCLFQENGEVLYDSDDAGRLNDLHQFKQQYQVAAAHLAYPRANILERSLPNGELELTVQLAGAYSV
jgi:hypothetical protein